MSRGAIGLLFYDSRDVTETSGQTKVTDLYGTVVIDQDILWLKITMTDIGFVQVVQSTKDVVDYALALDLLKIPV